MHRQIMRIFGFSIALIYLASCSATSNNSTSNQVSSEEAVGSGPFFTYDHHNKPVLCWIESTKDFATSQLHYASFHKNKPRIKTVKKTRGLSPYAECMPKIAYKRDGTMLAMIHKRKPTPKNKFAGCIQYSLSSDNGKSWSPLKFVHQNTSVHIGRSYFDVERLPNGEIGVVWLDGRKKNQNGSTLFFASTEKGAGFENEIEIGQKVCQCCRTDLHVSNDNTIHAVFRDIIQDSIRDFAWVSSTDSGQSFGQPRIVSNDNWVINGCPHSGAAISSSPTSGKLHVAWYTRGGMPGIYFTSSDGASFEQRTLMDTNASHPQIIGWPNGTVYIAWDKRIDKKDGAFNQVVVSTIDHLGNRTTVFSTKNNVTATYPVIAKYSDYEIIVAWVQGKGENANVRYKIIEV